MKYQETPFGLLLPTSLTKMHFMTAASLPTFLKWGFWISPLAYAEIGISLNEFLAPRWQKVISQTTNIFYEN